MTNSLTLKVVGEKTMHCGGCEQSVSSTLMRLPGVQSAQADRTTQEIKVMVGGADTTLDTIQAELHALGYQVETA